MSMGTTEKYRRLVRHLRNDHEDRDVTTGWAWHELVQRHNDSHVGDGEPNGPNHTHVERATVTETIYKER